ncbi:MAG: hypothetical protein M1825_005276 [Sarcosagium campestre]|nr:MAG: hypothetical protein M1825_005276 [Sarcosagium campestre]
MALEPDQKDSDEGLLPGNGVHKPDRPVRGKTKSRGAETDAGPSDDDDEEETGDETDADNDEEEEGDEEEEDEPEVKYARLTSRLGGVYRNGDATSAFLVSGDKMIIGTHNGNVHVYSIPLFQPLRVYHAHSASVTAVSISPFPPPIPSGKPDAVNRIVSQANQSSQKSSSSKAGASASSSKSPSHQPPPPPTPSNSIHIATSSIDGNVCIASLVDPKDVLLRNFARPVQSVAISPEFKTDRTYISGGLAGKLILTSGGRAGTSSTASSGGGAAAAAGWLGSMGLGSNTAKDTVLHSGEGSISTIKWSLSGKYVVWINEKGIKIMRSNLHLDSADVDYAWKRIAHVDHPYGEKWDEMSSVWKARAEWIKDTGLETGLGQPQEHPRTDNGPSNEDIFTAPNKVLPKSGIKKPEILAVGWGNTAWIIHVHPGGPGTGKEAGERSLGKAEVHAKTQLEDCIISGLSLYTPSLLLVLAYDLSNGSDDGQLPSDQRRGPARQQKSSSQASEITPRRGKHQNRNALEPELRLIDLSKSGEDADLSADTLTMSRFEGLTASDYHLGILPSSRGQAQPLIQSYGLAGLGAGFWSASVNATKVFTSTASVKSQDSKSDGSASGKVTGIIKAQGMEALSKDIHPAAASPGMKIYIHSPYDCVLATKRDRSDHLSWLLERHRFKDAWNLVDQHPEAIKSNSQARTADSVHTSPETPSNDDFYAAESPTAHEIPVDIRFSVIEKEKRRIGEEWIQQLISRDDWATAGQVCGKVLGTSPRWEHWVWVFAQANRFEEVTPFIPATQIRPSLPSLVYELVLGHYIAVDRERLQELLDRWPPELFDVKSVTDAIEQKLRSGEINEERSQEGGRSNRDWRILTESLGKLLVADGRYREALEYFIQLQDADTAMALIRDHRLLDAVSDDISGLIRLRVTKEQSRTAPLSELESVTSEVIGLLVEEARQGVVRADLVVNQLHQEREYIFLFFYLRGLWQGGVGSTELAETRFQPEQALADSRALVENFGDIVVDVFAEYDRPLFMEFLKSSQSYTFEQASDVCERRNYVPELVYLFSKTGQTKHALKLIIDRLDDVSQAIAFAKEQDDSNLWDDLLEYSMDKPRFIRGLLEEVGTAIDPIKLVRRIPDGLEIEGLRDGLIRMLREYEIQDSINEGVARVLRGEVGMSMDKLRLGQRRGIKFDIFDAGLQSLKMSDAAPPEAHVFENAKGNDGVIKAGHCVGCETSFPEDEKETLIGFACGHIFHLSCLVDYERDTDQLVRSDDGIDVSYEGDSGSTGRSVGAKVTHARIIRDRIADGCPALVHKKTAY